MNIELAADRMADPMDQATQREAEMLAESLSRLRKEPPPPKDWDGLTCYECGDDLPQARILNKRFTCVPCKSEQEAREKRKGV